MSPYITKNRFRKKCLLLKRDANNNIIYTAVEGRQVPVYQEVNIPYGTQCELNSNMIYWDNKPICLTTSQSAYDYFCRNDDGRGLERGKLIDEIQDRLKKRDSNYQTRWDKLWDDDYCHKFRRREYGDHWTWSFDFYNAEIKDLQYILNKIKEVK